MSEKKMRILITGATGFIGARLTKALLADGHTIGIILRKGSSTSRLSSVISGLTRLHADVRDGDAISRIFAEFKPDIVIHLVTTYAVEHVPSDIGVMLDTNVKGTINLLDAARVHGVKLFVNTSTCAVYAQKDHALSEADAISPQNLYAVTKVQAEDACKFYAENYDVNGITLRLFPPFGPGDHARRLIPFVIQSFLDGKSPSLTTGLQKWDFVYVDDIVEAYRCVIRAYPFRLRYDVVNIGTGNPASIRDVVLTIQQLTKSSVPLAWGAVPHRKNEVWFNSANITKAADLLGWSPKTDLKTGLEKTIRSIQSGTSNAS
jgi:nucleoside-diphosphate-sugar epimerase